MIKEEDWTVIDIWTYKALRKFALYSGITLFMLFFGFGAAIASFMFGLTVKLMMKIVCYNMSVCSQYWKKRHPSWKDENHE
ncbi:hypothetical protein [Shigella sonnei]|uniref:hypothetical protein n=1 Tax=Shigella sonnei TaxID=624 RepID=UPI000DA429F7|nr:hypothetical protein [Shigella sonnei]SRV24421.1 Uncharacterised protein [Shigella sonnei]